MMRFNSARLAQEADTLLDYCDILDNYMSPEVDMHAQEVQRN